MNNRNGIRSNDNRPFKVALQLDLAITTERTKFLRHCLSPSISVISPLRSDEDWKNA
jgi:hypothetical protein